GMVAQAEVALSVRGRGGAGAGGRRRLPEAQGGRAFSSPARRGWRSTSRASGRDTSSSWRAAPGAAGAASAASGCAKIGAGSRVLRSSGLLYRTASDEMKDVTHRRRGRESSRKPRGLADGGEGRAPPPIGETPGATGLATRGPNAAL